MRLEVVGLGEERFVGGDERQPGAVGERDQLRLDVPLLVEAVALHLHVEPIAEGLVQQREARRRERPGARPRKAASSGPESPPVSAMRPVAPADEDRRHDARRVAERRRRNRRDWRGA